MKITKLFFVTVLFFANLVFAESFSSVNLSDSTLSCHSDSMTKTQAKHWFNGVHLHLLVGSISMNFPDFNDGILMGDHEGLIFAIVPRIRTNSYVFFEPGFRFLQTKANYQELPKDPWNATQKYNITLTKIMGTLGIGLGVRINVVELSARCGVTYDLGLTNRNGGGDNYTYTSSGFGGDIDGQIAFVLLPHILFPIRFGYGFTESDDMQRFEFLGNGKWYSSTKEKNRTQGYSGMYIMTGLVIALGST